MPSTLEHTGQDPAPSDAQGSAAPASSFFASAPVVSLPKGGGAIRGIGEKFAANPVTGTGSMTVPIATSPGRSGFGPQLSVAYDSGAGNGPFGLGWNLALPTVTRKTDKGLPRYFDAEESDVFILSGAEDLVPVLEPSKGDWQRPSPSVGNTAGVAYQVERFRPRIEGLFARIERWTNPADRTDVFWRSITKDNLTTFYGKTANSRIADPADPSRIFSWLICESHDDKGNAMDYEYAAENSSNVDTQQANERNRTDATRSANRYLKRILYGNQTPYVRGEDLAARQDWLFELVFDYGDGHFQSLSQPGDDPQFATASVAPTTTWPARLDAFSSHRSTFEVRTYRLCRRVLMFHHVPDGPSGEPGYDGLVRSTDFTYDENPVATKLLSVTHTGYALDQAANRHRLKSLPPVEFTYSEAVINPTVHEIDAASLENLPSGLDGGGYQWVDLDGEGISGILTEQATGWFYKRNLSPLPASNANNPAEKPVTARFAPIELVAPKPALSLEAGHAQFMDLAGDGQPDLVALGNPVPGFYERTDEEDWESFRTFRSFPNLETRDPNLRFLDLDGDGHADILISEDEVFRWYPSLAEDGFGPEERTHQSRDEEAGPQLLFADGTQSIYLADMSGDGLTDLVRVRNGEVCYWPNLGYGRFGSKVAMDHAPWFDVADQFDQKRVRLADIDGSGTTDIIYLGGDGVRIYFNQSGNGWSAPQSLPLFPAIDSLASITTVDLLGNGTACLVWSSPLPGDAGRQMRYINLMGGQKPHLLVKSINNLGAETRVSYASSTKFYLADKLAGRPWVTKLPFPVHVVERVETFDLLSRNRFVTRYAYAHGYFDGEEREFRGFGYVEQRDTEELAALTATDPLASIVGESHGEGAANLDAASYVPPVVTKTWFHTGAWLEEEKISQHLAHEYFGAPRESDPNFDQKWAAFETALLPDTVFPDTIRIPEDPKQPGVTRIPYSLTNDEQREAARALKGSILRQEIYAKDGTVKAALPYSASERDYTIECLQPQAGNRHAVFFVHPRETIAYHYERNPADPRVTHNLVLEVDPVGNVLRSAAIGYGRQLDDPTLLPADQARQKRTHITYTENAFTNGIDLSDDYRAPLPCESRTYELLNALAGLPSPASEIPGESGTMRFRFDDLNAVTDSLSDGTNDLPYLSWNVDENALPGARRRLIEHVRTLYRDNHLTGPKQGLVPLKQLGSLALPGEAYKLAFTPEVLSQIYRRPHANAPLEDLLPNPIPILRDEGGYVLSDDQQALGLFPASDPAGIWWIPSGRSFFSRAPGDTPAQEAAEAQAHFFVPRRFQDPFGNAGFVDYDAHDLLVSQTEDALQNIVTAEHDYRALQPQLITDPNGNRAQVAFDTLGLVAGTAVMGKATENKGDSLVGFKADLTAAEIAAFLTAPDPHVPAPNLLAGATTRIVYDLDRFRQTRLANPADPTRWQPVYAATLVRETHLNDPLPPGGLKIQISFSYSDGFGREMQKKVQAEPGPLDLTDKNAPIVNPRWVGSGWTIFNNKGKPVRKYEPFFSATHDFEFAKVVGVSSTLFYDPVERVVATLHPNHTYEKVLFDPWSQETWDVNDTLLLDPSKDDDVKEFFLRLPATDCQPSWYDVRTDDALALQEWPGNSQRMQDRRASEKAAALQTEAHAATSTRAFFDTLGRPFLSIAHNRKLKGDPDEFYSTRTVLDIEANQREVIDAKDRIVMRYDYDLLGTRIHQASMEAGERWMLNDVTGKTIRSWDSRDHTFRAEYDALRRPLSSFVVGADPLNPQQEILFDRIVYGEVHPDSQPSPGNNPAPCQLNLRGKPYLHLDQAGVVRNEGHDFKGNLLASSRQFAQEYRHAIDWSALESVPGLGSAGASPAVAGAPPATLDLTALDIQLSPLLEAETFQTSTTYDALNRPTSQTTPDQSVTRPIYNEANLLERVAVNLRGAPTATDFVTNIDYDAKGQRVLIEYGNHSRTRYDYDPLTFRLLRLRTTRAAVPDNLASQLFTDPAVVQDLNYTYDPTGNITQIADLSLARLSSTGPPDNAPCDYLYDAINRLIHATGREHIGQTAIQSPPPQFNYRDHPFVGLTASIANPNDLQAMQRYTERYDYDEVGNFLHWTHHAPNHPWTRAYDYNEPSLIAPSTFSNRLSGTTAVGNPETYSHDAHGNMTSMPHPSAMEWDFLDRLILTTCQAVNPSAPPPAVPETTYYIYDSSRQRVRKVTHTSTGTRKSERLYLSGFEIYREYNGAPSPTLERETLHVIGDKQRIALTETHTHVAGFRVATPQPLFHYQLCNHLDSGCLELDNVGQTISHEEYHPYGTSSFQTGRSATEVSLKRYRFGGRDRDETTGLNHNGTRYYGGWLGRWTNTDPICLSGGINLFQYAAGNPITLLDSTGHKPTTTYLGSSKDENYVERLEKTWGGNQYWMDKGPNGTGWYVDTEGSRIIPIRTGVTVNTSSDTPDIPTTTPDPGEVPNDPMAPRTEDKPELFGLEGWVYRNPFKARAIGSGKADLEFTITGAANRLSGRGTEALPSSSDVHFENVQNALRHVTGEAAITVQFGEDVARTLGYAHEGEIPDLSVRVYKWSSNSAQDRERAWLKADTTADLLNNVLARKLGSANPGASSKELALKAVDYFEEHGLYLKRPSRSAGAYLVEQTKLPTEEAKAIRTRIEELDEYGYTQDELRELQSDF